MHERSSFEKARSDQKKGTGADSALTFKRHASIVRELLGSLSEVSRTLVLTILNQILLEANTANDKTALAVPACLGRPSSCDTPCEYDEKFSVLCFSSVEKLIKPRNEIYPIASTFGRPDAARDGTFNRTRRCGWRSSSTCESKEPL